MESVKSAGVALNREAPRTHLHPVMKTGLNSNNLAAYGRSFRCLCFPLIGCFASVQVQSIDGKTCSAIFGATTGLEAIPPGTLSVVGKTEDELYWSSDLRLQSEVIFEGKAYCENVRSSLLHSHDFRVPRKSVFHPTVQISSAVYAHATQMIVLDMAHNGFCSCTTSPGLIAAASADANLSALQRLSYARHWLFAGDFFSEMLGNGDTTVELCATRITGQQIWIWIIKTVIRRQRLQVDLSLPVWIYTIKRVPASPILEFLLSKYRALGLPFLYTYLKCGSAYVQGGTSLLLHSSPHALSIGHFSRRDQPVNSLPVSGSESTPPSNVHCAFISAPAEGFASPSSCPQQIDRRLVTTPSMVVVAPDVTSAADTKRFWGLSVSSAMCASKRFKKRVTLISGKIKRQVSFDRFRKFGCLVSGRTLNPPTLNEKSGGMSQDLKTCHSAQSLSDWTTLAALNPFERLSLLSFIVQWAEKETRSLINLEHLLCSEDSPEVVLLKLSSKGFPCKMNLVLQADAESAAKFVCDRIPAILKKGSLHGSPLATRLIVEILDLIIGHCSCSNMTSTNANLDGRMRRRLIRALIRIAEATGVFPSSLFVRHVKLESSDPFIGGGSADLFRATYNHHTVALKRLRVFEEDVVRGKLNMAVCKEVLIWKYMCHPNVLAFEGIDDASFSPLICLVSPFMPSGSIAAYLSDHPDKRSSVPHLATEAAEGLYYLHLNGVIHGDIKAANILINNGHACIADFGLSVMSDATRIANASDSGTSGSIRWMAPELHLPENFGLDEFTPTPASDVYAFGCTLLEVFSGRIPFYDVRVDFQVIVRCVNGERPHQPPECINYKISPQLWYLLEQCWYQDRKTRPPMGDIVIELRRMYQTAGQSARSTVKHVSRWLRGRRQGRSTGMSSV